MAGGRLVLEFGDASDSTSAESLGAVTTVRRPLGRRAVLLGSHRGSSGPLGRAEAARGGGRGALGGHIRIWGPGRAYNFFLAATIYL